MYSRILDITPRLMWNEFNGYCGETSFICAGLYYGQYYSQYDMRTHAYYKGHKAQTDCQLLLGVNDIEAARRSDLNYTPHKFYDHKDCLAWIKHMIYLGHPVAVGLYMNNSIFQDGSTDGEYDHIVLVTGFESKHKLDDGLFHEEDIIIFSDHGLYTPNEPNNPPFLFARKCSDFVRDRKDSSKKNAPAYSLPKDAQHVGVFKGRYSSLPLQLRPAKNSEIPDIHKNGKRPTARPLNISAFVDNLDPFSRYRITDNHGHEAIITGVSSWSRLSSIKTSEKLIYKLEILE